MQVLTFPLFAGDYVKGIFAPRTFKSDNLELTR